MGTNNLKKQQESQLDPIMANNLCTPLYHCMDYVNDKMSLNVHKRFQLMEVSHLGPKGAASSTLG